MGDTEAERNGNGAHEEGEEEAAKGNTEESSTEEEDDEDSDDGTDDEGDTEPDDEEGDDKGKGKDDEDDGDEPPTRKPKTNADFVALRRGKKIEKLAKGKGDDKGGAADEDDEDDDGLSPEDAAAIDKRLEKHLAPILAEKEQQEVDTQIANFISENPEFKPYAAKAAKWARHEAYKNVALEQIFYAAAGKDLLKIGAKRKQGADSEAKKGRTGGGSGDDKGGSKNWHGASHDDVGKEIERIKLGGR